MNIANWDGLAFVADAMHRDDPAIFHEKPQHTGVELADVSQFKQPIAKRLGQRLPVILPVPQLLPDRQPPPQSRPDHWPSTRPGTPAQDTSPPLFRKTLR